MGAFESAAAARSDWTDQDLLTFDQAEERLALEEATLAKAVAAGGTDAATAQDRLRAVRALRRQLISRRGLTESP